MNIFEIVKKHAKIIITAATITATSVYCGFANNILAGNTISTTTEKSAVMEQKIETKIDQIISDLISREADCMRYPIHCSCIVQKYIIEHNRYDPSILNEIESMSPKESITWQLYNAVVNERSVSLGNSLMFQRIMKRFGVKASILGYSENPTDKIHAFNAIKFNPRTECFYNSTYDPHKNDEWQKIINRDKSGLIEIPTILNYRISSAIPHSQIYHFVTSTGQWELYQI